MGNTHAIRNDRFHPPKKGKGKTGGFKALQRQERRERAYLRGAERPKER